MHAQRAVVVHLHGDYLYPRMLNTVHELEHYPDEIETLLDQVFDEYGLVVAGWSAKYDEALRQALARSKSRRFGTYWIDPFELTDYARHLVTARQATVVRTPAEEFFARAADAVKAIEQKGDTHPASIEVAVATAKRWLGGAGTAIPLHDMVRTELERARAVITTAERVEFETGDHDNEYRRRLDRVVAQSLILLALTGTIAYWGNEETDSWWMDAFEELIPYRRHSGVVSLIELQRVPGMLLFAAGGIAAMAAKRFNIVAQLLLRTTLPRPYGDKRQAAPDALMLHGKVDVDHPSRWLFYTLQEPLHRAVGRGEIFRRAWEAWEYTLLAYFAWRRPERTNLRFEPYLRADENGLDRYVATCASGIREEYERLGAQHPLLIGGVFDGDLGTAMAAFDSVDSAFRAYVDQQSWKGVPPGVVVTLPSDVHYPGFPKDPVQ